MKYIVLIIIALFAMEISAQTTETADIKFKVFGNCNMCKTRIEKSLDIPEVKFVKWNKITKNLHVIFENSISVDSLQQRIAFVGHDTEKFKADSLVYSKLPKCCLYRDNAKTH